MPLPTTIADLSTTASSNYPSGTDTPSTLDNAHRTLASFVAQLRDDPTANIVAPIPVADGGTGSATAADARTALGAAESGANSTITSLSGLTTPLSVAQGGTGTTTGAVSRSHIAGCTLSTAGSSATMSIAAGQATDSTNTVSMNLSAIAKTTSAWAVGTAQGGLDTGTIANNTWYHFYVIRRPDTGVVDVVFSTSASSPTLPTNYTQYRRIGSGRTNGSAQWVSFTQDGDYFVWSAAELDVNTTNPGTASVSVVLSVPTGVNVIADLNVSLKQTSTVTFGYVRDLAVGDLAPSQSSAPLSNFGSDTISGAFLASQIRVRTNTSAQIGYRMNTSDANVIVRMATNGWIDSRGRNA